MDPFRGYVGKSVRLEDELYVVVGHELEGRRLQFVLQGVATESRRRVPVTSMLDGLVESSRAATR